MSVKRLIIKRLVGLSGEKFPVVSIFGVLGVFVGVFAVITVISVMYGFQDQLVRRIVGFQPHIYITNSNSPSAMENWQQLNSKISSLSDVKNGNVILSPFVESEVIVYFNDVTIGAVAFSVSDKMFDSILAPQVLHREVLLGEQLGFSNQLVKKDSIEVVSGWDAVSSSLAPRARKFVVKDFLRTGTYARDFKYAYFNIDDATSYFTPVKGVPSGLSLFCLDVSKVQEVADKIKKILKEEPFVKVETWQDRNQKLFYSLKIERVAMILTLFFIILVASFSITVSLVMMVESKRSDFAILSSLGLLKAELNRVVLYVSLLKGIFGAVFGGVFGSLFCYLIDKYELITLPSIYYDTHMPVRIDLGFNLIVVLIAVAVCVAGALFPLRIMSKLSIISELRKH